MLSTSLNQEELGVSRADYKLCCPEQPYVFFSSLTGYLFFFATPSPLPTGLWGQSLKARLHRHSRRGGDAFVLCLVFFLIILLCYCHDSYTGRANTQSRRPVMWIIPTMCVLHRISAIARTSCPFSLAKQDCALPRAPMAQVMSLRFNGTLGAFRTLLVLAIIRSNNDSIYI